MVIHDLGASVFCLFPRRTLYALDDPVESSVCIFLSFFFPGHR